MRRHILAIDQGTTSTRCIVFRPDLSVAAVAQKEFPQHFPDSGWVEHDPEDIWATVLSTGRAALRKARLKAKDIAAIGITNQRETTVLWDRATGKPIHNAIVWQDRRTAGICAALKAAGHEKDFAAKTGLLLDPYFSGTKVKWLLDNVKGARAAAEKGKLAFGTIDSFLISRLTRGRVHATDATNASRTLMMDIGAGGWDDGLLSSSTSRAPSFLRSGIARRTTEPPTPSGSAARFRFSGSPAISRPPPSARPASSQA